MKDNYKTLSSHYNATLDQAPWDMALYQLFPPFGGFFIDTTFNATNVSFIPYDVNVPQRNIFFGSRGGVKYMYLTTCAVAVTYVEANVTCESHGTVSKPQCAVDRIRQMPHPPMDPHYTGFEHPTRENIIQWFPEIVNPQGSQHLATSTQTEHFIFDPVNSVIGNVTDGQSRINIELVWVASKSEELS